MSDLKKIRVQHVDRDAKGVEIKTDVDVITDADCITMDDVDLRSGVKKMIDDRIGEVIDGAPEELDTLKEIATELEKNQSGVSTILNRLKMKLDKSVFDEEVKGLSGNIVDLDNAIAHNQDVIEETIKRFYEEYEKEIELKVDKVEGKGLSTNDFTNSYKQKLDNIPSNAKYTDTTYDLSPYAKSSEVPSRLSQLSNDRSFKTESEIRAMIDSAAKLKKEVVTSLPSTGKDDVIYLVKDSSGKADNVYLEYLWIAGAFELIGSTKVDLSGYAKMTDVHEMGNTIGRNMYNHLEYKLDKSQISQDFTNDDRNTVPSSHVFFSVFDQIIDEVEKKASKKEIADFKRCVVLSETNYAALSDAEKSRADTLYFLL